MPMTKDEALRHENALIDAGIMDGLYRAIWAIEQDKEEHQPSHKWLGMNAAVAAIRRVIAERILIANERDFGNSAVVPGLKTGDR